MPNDFRSSGKVTASRSTRDALHVDLRGAAKRTREEVLVAFDLIEHDGDDLRDLPLIERKRLSPNSQTKARFRKDIPIGSSDQYGRDAGHADRGYPKAVHD